MASDDALADKIARVASRDVRSSAACRRRVDAYMKPETLTEIQWIALDFSDGTLPGSGGHVVPSTNKRILKHIAQYQLSSSAFPENTWRDKDGLFTSYTAPLEVTLCLGGKPRKFNLMDQRRLDYSQRYDVYIQTHNMDYPGTKACPKYQDILTHLCDSDKTVEARRAELIIDALEQPPTKQVLWETATVNGQPVFTMQKIRAAVELIALTHVTECTPDPSSEQLRNYAADKWARSVLRRIISDPHLTFSLAFSADGGLYFPCRNGGKDLASDIFSGKRKVQGLEREILLAISDDSDVE